MRQSFATHDVTNQSPPFEDVNLYETDSALKEAVLREGPGGDTASLAAFGAICGSAHAADLARLANEITPRLRSFDAKGRRRDVVDYHPAYHELMALAFAQGLHCSTAEPVSAAAKAEPRHVIRAAGLYLAAQMEPGHCCPVTMTHAAIPSLALAPDLAAEWLPRILSRRYDPAFKPARAKTAVTIGMGMTEKQGGTDVRANATRAEPAGLPGPGREYVLTGHKWFMSAPMCDAFLVLAQAKGGLSCFLVPRFKPDDSQNALALQRLKDKLGNRANASSEVEFQGAAGWLVGDEGRGVPVIIEMVSRTRLDCALSSAGLMRQALAQAIHQTSHRSVFQKKLVDQPMMLEVLADMALDVEAATALVFRLARALDRDGDPRARAWARLMTPAVKYWVCKMATPLIGEAMECLGGNGYVEELVLPRLYREAPVNAIWEGSGNVMALDVLRVLQREPHVAAIVVDDLAAATAGDPHLAAGQERLNTILHEPRLLDRRARLLTESLAVLWAGSILRAAAPSYVADAFIASRLSGLPRHTYGQGIDWADARAIVARASPL